MMDPQPTSERRGFAAMSPELRREIGRLGGKAVHARGTGHRFTSETGREAGKKGGRVSRMRGVTPRFTSATAREAGRLGGAAVSVDRDHMSHIGRIGAQRRNARRTSERRDGENKGSPSSDKSVG